MILNAITDNPYFILAVILIVFAGIAVLVFLLRKFLPGFKEKDEPVSEDQAIKEELERVLVDIEDEETKKQLDTLNAENQADESEDGE